MRNKIIATTLFLGSATSILWLHRDLPDEVQAIPRLAVISAVIFFVATAGIFTKTRLGYGLGFVAGLIALGWFVPIESINFPTLNSWIGLNLPDGDPYIFMIKLRIFFAATTVTAVAVSLTGLLPAHWILRKLPV